MVLLSAALSVAIACGDDDAGTDSGGEDGGTDTSVPDSAVDTAVDSPTLDAPVVDVGPADAPPPGKIAAFIAQGHLGRTTVSCDDGRTWVGNRSLDDGAVCWPESGPELDCDHHTGAGKGITYGRGYFYTTWGWGSPGGVDRSTDGLTWERVVPDTNYGGIAFGNDVVLAASRNPQRSLDVGASWESTGDTMLDVFNVRRSQFVDAMGGRFVMVASDSDNINVALSSDAGATWFRPTTIDAACGSGLQTRGGIASAGDTIVIVGSDGLACASDDGGITWTTDTVADSVSSQLVYTGTEFMAWGRGTAYRSATGTGWTSQETTPNNLDIGAVAYNPDSGMFVAVRGGWQNWYDEQMFYRSVDGVVWEEATEFVGQHPIRFIGFGYVDPSADCPD